MKPKLFAFLLLLGGITGCGPKSAFNYSEAIVRIEKSMEPDAKTADEELGRLLMNGNYDSAVVVTRRMENLVAGKQKEVEQLEMPRVKEADNFRRAAIRYFSYIKGLYTAYKRYAMQTNEEDRETERKRLLRIIEDKSDAIENMQRAQRKYAEANGFRIKD